MKLKKYSIEWRYLFEKTELKALTITQRSNFDDLVGFPTQFFVQMEEYKEGDWRYIPNTSHEAKTEAAAVVILESMARKYNSETEE